MRDLKTKQGRWFRALGTSVAANIKSTPGEVLAYSCLNLNTAIRYFQLHDLSTAPAGGETPLTSEPVYPNNGLLIIDSSFLGKYGTRLDTGISFAFSTTPFIYTAGVATDAIIKVRYV